jgi:adenosylcobinamide-phosphate synthase
MALAMAVDGLLGWPGELHSRIGHPVAWLGRLIDALDERFNRDEYPAGRRRLAGAASAILVIALAGVVAHALQSLTGSGWSRVLLVGILAWPFVALRSLYDHVASVAKSLQARDLAMARQAVSHIVGRDPQQLDEAGIARAAIESLAENASDGIVAPVFWGVLFGLPGIVAYKAINTLDSMIAHRTPRHEAFGWAAARIDDIANFVPARLTGLLFVLVAAKPVEAMACMLRDARYHRSPNAGWPEAARAGALEIRLCGPRVYHGVLAPEPWLNAHARDPEGADIGGALSLYVRAMIALAGLLVLLALL